jgi:hypothetical protein
MTYPYKVWLFTITTAPVLLLVRVWSFVSNDSKEFTPAFAFLFLFILYGAAFSLPSLFLFRLLHRNLRYASYKKWLQKLIYGFVGVLMIWITFYLMDRDLISKATFNELVWPIIYSICLIMGALLFDNKPKSVIAAET